MMLLPYEVVMADMRMAYLQATASPATGSFNSECPGAVAPIVHQLCPKLCRMLVAVSNGRGSQQFFYIPIRLDRPSRIFQVSHPVSAGSIFFRREIITRRPPRRLVAMKLWSSNGLDKASRVEHETSPAAGTWVCGKSECFPPGGAKLMYSLTIARLFCRFSGLYLPGNQTWQWKIHYL